VRDYPKGKHGQTLRTVLIYNKGNNIMGNRFGRNKKRALKAQIESLTKQTVEIDERNVNLMNTNRNILTEGTPKYDNQNKN
tara:strand:- start:3831 stop:4073 length:243 start_codon:yes stop_codon:yes gene_type:complete